MYDLQTAQRMLDETKTWANWMVYNLIDKWEILEDKMVCVNTKDQLKLLYLEMKEIADEEWSE